MPSGTIELNRSGDVDVRPLTPRNEGSPAALIDGMAAGLPVVPASAAGVPDPVDECGHDHPAVPDDAAALAALSLRSAGPPPAPASATPGTDKITTHERTERAC